jgi:uncharacterized glyoxalase superfamily protein PhnB
MNELIRNKGLSSAVSYRDPKPAFRFLETAFGFEPLFVILDADNAFVHAEMRFGDTVLMIGREWSDDHRSPCSIDGKNTQSVHVQLAEGDDIDAHCEHARASGAVIVTEPVTHFYGERTYQAKDPEGHIWTIGVIVQRITPEQWDAVSGLTTRARLD